MSSRVLRAAVTALAGASLVLVAACSDDPSGPEVRPESRLNIVLQAPTAPLLSATSKQVWVKRGTDTELRLYYRPLIVGGDSAEFLRLRFEDNTLLARPDGSPIAVGDSVLVTVSVPDPTRFFVTLEPTGLRFDPRSPAELKWKLSEKDDDLDDDGDIDGADASLYSSVAVWRQETSGQPWTRLVSQLEVQIDEIEARLTGFSNYVVAY